MPSASRLSEPAAPPPLVIVEGFLSSAGALIWGNFEEHSNYACQTNGEQPRRTIFARVGPVSSLHDRACELFYSLVGGTVDYGEEHAGEHGHLRYGRTHETGLYPEWSVTRPLHFLGHSVGGPTIVKLQTLLSKGFFGDQHHPDMIVSVNSISAPFRGTQLVYSLGEETQSAPNVRPFSWGSVLTKSVHVLAYATPLLPGFLDMRSEARQLSYRQSSWSGLLKQLWRSDWAESKDATPYDVTFEAADAREADLEGLVNPNTFYRSYTACMIDREEKAADDFTPPWKHLLSALPLYLSSLTMASFDFSALRPVPSFLQASPPPEAKLEEGTVAMEAGVEAAARANDGVVPLFSQWHPFDCASTRCRHFDYAHTQSTIFTASEKRARVVRAGPEAGIWHVHHMDDAHHLSIVPFWLGTARQRMFWRDLGEWLRAIDISVGVRGRED